MKVICINNGPIQKKSGKVVSAPELIEGLTYTCLDTIIDGAGSHGYILEEIKAPGNPWGSYKQSRFIPLSSISETEFVRNYNTEKV